LRRESLNRKKFSSLPDFLSRPTAGPCRHVKSSRSESPNCLVLYSYGLGEIVRVNSRAYEKFDADD
ncbi:MAG: hypothetical protein AAEC03_00970, partial [Synechococcus sp.]